MKLCLIKVAKSDACIRPLFANPVTYGITEIRYGVEFSIIYQSFNCKATRPILHAVTVVEGNF